MRKVSVARDAGLIHVYQNRRKNGDNVRFLGDKTGSEAVSSEVMLELSHLKYC